MAKIEITGTTENGRKVLFDGKEASQKEQKRILSIIDKRVGS